MRRMLCVILRNGFIRGNELVNEGFYGGYVSGRVFLG